MRGRNILSAALAFLMILISVFFGASIHNAGENIHITHLNEMDNIHYFDAELIPKLNFQAAMYTLPLIATILVVQGLIAMGSKVRQVRNIAIGLFIAALIVITFDILTLWDPEAYNFNRWGYVWITMGVFIVAGNGISVFVKGNAGKKV